jgi:hypothetical protein
MSYVFRPMGQPLFVDQTLCPIFTLVV